MSQAVEAYRGTTALDELKRKHLKISREMARHDEAQAINNAVKRIEELWQSIIADKEAILANNNITLTEKKAARALINEIVMEKETTTEEKKAKIAKLRALLIG